MWSDSTNQICFLDVETDEHLIENLESFLSNKSSKKDNSKKSSDRNYFSLNLCHNQLLNNLQNLTSSNDHSQLIDQVICNYNCLNNELVFDGKKMSNQNKCSISSVLLNETRDLYPVEYPLNSKLDSLLIRKSKLFDYSPIWTGKEKQSKF